MKRLRSRSAAAVLVLGVAVAGAVTLRHTSERQALPSDSYRITYHVEVFVGAKATVTTDVLEVHRPFLGSVVSHEATDPSGPVSGGQIDTDDGSFLIDNSSTGLLARQVRRSEALPTGLDLRLQPALTVGGRQGLVGVGAAQTVAGVTCTDYLSSQPLDGGLWQKPAQGNLVTSCVSADGHLLADRWTIDGKPVRTRTALRVEYHVTGPYTPMSGLTVKPLSQELPGVVSSPVPRPASTPIAVRATRTPPGLSLVRVANVGQLGANNPLASVESLGERQVYSDGSDVVVLTQTRRIQAQETAPHLVGEPVDLGPLGSGTLLPEPFGLQITIELSSQVTVTAVGTIGEPALLDWLRTVTVTLPR